MEETRLFQVLHTLDPVYDARSRVLLLGSMPSPKSRETGFYYGNPQNRFWRVLAAVLSADVPLSVAEKRALCLSRGVALWDVLAACRIRGAADASIREAKANDIGWLLKRRRSRRSSPPAAQRRSFIKSSSCRRPAWKQSPFRPPAPPTAA